MSFNHNHCTLMGRLSKDPDFKVLSETTKVLNFYLAISRKHKLQGDSPETDFIPITAWGNLADIGQRYLSKGTPVLVCGRINIRTYETNNEKKWKTEVIAESFQILEKLTKLEA